MDTIICKDPNMCTGCTACASICPKQCITMKENNEGFLYPEKELYKCIDCGICNKVCPINRPLEIAHDLPQTFVVRTKNRCFLEKCTSGGVFTTLAYEFVRNGGVAYGAIYDDDFNVVHSRVDNIEHIENLAGSKYIQSFLGDTFKSVKKDLSGKQKVLFCGTPCQVAGVKAFLQKNYDNLYCVDLVCHGVPSPKIWRAYLKLIQEKNGKLSYVNFRSKYYGYHVSVMEERFPNNKIVVGSARTNLMSKIFFKNIADRKSCYDCQFKTINRCSDITIYDSWHASELVHGLKDDDKGYTNVIIQSTKGKMVFDKYIKKSMETYPVDTIEAIKKDGIMITNSVKEDLNREAFYQCFNGKGINTAVDYFLPISKKDYLIEKVKLFLYFIGILRSVKKVKELFSLALKKLTEV